MPRAVATTAAADRGAIWLGLLVLYLVWGSTYLAISIAVETLPPFLMAAVRFGIASAVMFGWVVLRQRGRIQWPSRREWRDSAVVGTLLLAGGMGFVSWGSQTIPSGIVALLIAMMPMWVAIFGAILLGQRLPRLAGAGVVVGFAGVALLVGPTISGGNGALDPAGLAVVLLSPISWSLGSLYASHRARLPGDPIMATAAQMSIGAIALATLGVATGEPASLSGAVFSIDSLVALAYLTIVGSLLAFTTYGWLLRVAPLPLVITYAYVNPVVAVILGGLVRQEPIDGRTVLAGAVIVAAVALIVTARGRMSAPERISLPPAPSERPVARVPSP